MPHLLPFSSPNSKSPPTLGSSDDTGWDRPATVTLWPSLTAKRGQLWAGTWREWFTSARFQAPPQIADKHAAPGWSPALFAENRRGKAYVRRIGSIDADFDAGTSLEEATALWAPYAGIIHTTWSHRPEWPRFRVGLVASRDVIPTEHACLLEWLASRARRAGHPIDESAKDASRLWFQPAVRPGGLPDYRLIYLPGAPVDVDAVLREIAPPRLHVVPDSLRTPEGASPAANQAHTTEPSTRALPIPQGTSTPMQGFLAHAFAHAGWLGPACGPTKVAVRCPWEHEHTSGTRFDTSTILFAPSAGNAIGKFHCLHAHCVHRSLQDVLGALPPASLLAAERALAPSGPHDEGAPRLLEAPQAVDLLTKAIRDATGLTVIRSTTGAGKTAATIAALADQGQPAALFVPTHKLADQLVTDFHAKGVAASAPKGVTRLRIVHQDADTSACVYPELAAGLAQAGAPVREVLCAACPHQKNHPTNGATCPAYQQGIDQTSPIRVLQSVLAARVLADLADHLTSTDEATTPEPVRTVVIDEPPTLTESVHVDPGEARRALDRERANLTEDTYERLAPLVAYTLRGLQNGGRAGMSLRALALAGTEGQQEVVERTLAEAREVRAVAWTTTAHKRLARLGIDHPNAAASWLKRMQTVDRLLGALLEAAHAPDAPFVVVDDDGAFGWVCRARWTRECRRFVAAGGRALVLDATADLPALRAALGTDGTEVRIDVADAPGVERVWVAWSSGARSRHTRAGGQQPKAKELRGPLRDLAKRVQAQGARTVVVITDLPTARGLRVEVEALRTHPEKAPTLLPPEWRALVQAGVQLEIAHFGSLRGLDCWKDVDALCTLGDPWPGLAPAFAEAATLGLEQDAHLQHKAQAELEQAHGRGRPVHRTTPLLMLHYGRLQPQAPQWTPQSKAQLKRGRPPATNAEGRPWDASGWAEERARLGLSRSAHAKKLGIRVATYLRLSAKPPAAIQNSFKEETDGGGRNPWRGVLDRHKPEPNPPAAAPFVRGEEEGEEREAILEVEAGFDRHEAERRAGFPLPSQGSRSQQGACGGGAGRRAEGSRVAPLAPRAPPGDKPSPRRASCRGVLIRSLREWGSAPACREGGRVR